MSWRKGVLIWFGPGLLGGISFGDWWALLRENGFTVEPAYLLRATIITLNSLVNSTARRREEILYGREIAATGVQPPIFVLGIWRSGTTHLQNLFAVDERFAFPNWYQTSYPQTFLCTEATSSRSRGFFIPETRIQDNMSFGFALPAEEEFALATITHRSAMLSWVFPRRAEYYDRFLTFRGVPDSEIASWKAAFLWFVKKLTFKAQRPLVLKSPPHTARIRLLLDVFPEAKFVHIHRNPYTVFQSACHTTREVMKFCCLQHPALDVEERAIRQYKEVYEAFFEEKGLIRSDRFHEVCFEELEHDPVGQMRKVYEALGLPEFGAVEPAVRRYVDSLSGYAKNRFPELALDLRKRLAREWQPYFSAWGYPT